MRSPNWKKFLAELGATGNVTAACEASGVAQAEACRRRGEDAAFAAEWEAALEEAADALELEARRRALEGTEKPVFYGGEERGRIREYSDSLLLALLKAVRPEKFRDRLEGSGREGAPLPGELLTAVNRYYGEPEAD